MHPIFFNTDLGVIDTNKIEFSYLEIGHDVWIGQGVKITNKCEKIGNGSIIGAGSIVTKDVKPYSIVAGNPAVEIGMRFDQEVIELLEQSKWYELSKEYLEKYIDFVEDPKEFATKIIQDFERKNDVSKN